MNYNIIKYFVKKSIKFVVYKFFILFIISIIYIP